MGRPHKDKNTSFDEQKKPKKAKSNDTLQLPRRRVQNPSEHLSAPVFHRTDKYFPRAKLWPVKTFQISRNKTPRHKSLSTLYSTVNHTAQAINPLIGPYIARPKHSSESTPLIYCSIMLIGHGSTLHPKRVVWSMVPHEPTVAVHLECDKVIVRQRETPPFSRERKFAAEDNTLRDLIETPKVNQLQTLLCLAAGLHNPKAPTFLFFLLRMCFSIRIRLYRC